MLGRLSTATALTKLTWECSELGEQLNAATDGNAHLSDEERRLLENRYTTLRRNLAEVMQKIEVVDKHLQPAIDALLREYAAVQEVATKAGLAAPTLTVPRMPFRRQGPLGYTQ